MARGLTTVMGFQAYNGSHGLQDGRPINGKSCHRALLPTPQRRLHLAGDRGYVRGISPAPASVCPVDFGEITTLVVLPKQTMHRKLKLPRLTRPLDSLRLVRDEHDACPLLHTIYTTSVQGMTLDGELEAGSVAFLENSPSLLLVSIAARLTSSQRLNPTCFYAFQQRSFRVP